MDFSIVKNSFKIILQTYFIHGIFNLASGKQR
jgi:hypothetical protein